jgi:putative DNA topoisomerase
MSKIDHSLFNADEHALEAAFGVCPLCQNKLVIKRGKTGAFIGCSAYPHCEYSKPLYDTETADIKVIEGSSCPECQAQLVVKKGRYGLFIGCSNFPQCHHISSIKQQHTKFKCPICEAGELVKRTGKTGKSFYACNQYPDCRYLLNHQPVMHSCPACQWPIMQERKTAAGLLWQCPQKQCQHKMANPST